MHCHDEILVVNNRQVLRGVIFSLNFSYIFFFTLTHLFIDFKVLDVLENGVQVLNTKTKIA